MGHLVGAGLAANHRQWAVALHNGHCWLQDLDTVKTRWGTKGPQRCSCGIVVVVNGPLRPLENGAVEVFRFLSTVGPAECPLRWCVEVGEGGKKKRSCIT